MVKNQKELKENMMKTCLLCIALLQYASVPLCSFPLLSVGLGRIMFPASQPVFQDVR